MWALARVYASQACKAGSRRCFSTRELIAVTDVRKGLILRLEDKYCQVKEFWACILLDSKVVLFFDLSKLVILWFH